MIEFEMHSDIILGMLQDLARLVRKHQKVVLDGGSLRIPEVVAVARYYDGHEPVQVYLDNARHSELERSVQNLNTMLENGLVIYGIQLTSTRSQCSFANADQRCKHWLWRIGRHSQQ